MRLKCEYKGKVILHKNDEILLEEELNFKSDLEPYDYIMEYLKKHKIDNLENFKIDFEFTPLVNKEWTFVDYKDGDYYIMPYFNETENGNITNIYKDFYIAENLLGSLYINAYRAIYNFNKFKNAAFLVFSCYNENIGEYEDILILSAPIKKKFTKEEIDKKIIEFCNLVSSNTNF